MKIKGQTRKLAADQLKHCFEVVDKTDTKNTVLRLWIELTESVSYTYGKVKLT
ncbi:lysyl-tRNA synthetase [Streptococcus pneumoniae]|uniref:lysyl-tRNA synthetase n=1 Tax=Streptococcus pneumoniae TaxID=1313 RepID=UPI000B59357F|nr:lysyl-tRNA synthetase [Streptococcus pneumoniae]